jgi:hypothetical protein
MTLLAALADATNQVTTEDIKKGYGSLIVTGCFFIALIIVAIWWLRRG